MAAAWMACPQCRLFFQREASQSACPGCGATLPPTAALGWFYVRDKKRLGPVPEEELKALAARGQLGRDDMVLHQGETRWAQASTVPGLFPPATHGVRIAEALLVQEPAPPGYTVQEAVLAEESPPRSPPAVSMSSAPPTSRAVWVTCPHCHVFVPVTEQEKSCPACQKDLRSPAAAAPPTVPPPQPILPPEPKPSASPTSRATWVTCPHCEVSVPVTESEKNCPACLKDITAPPSSPAEALIESAPPPPPPAKAPETPVSAREAPPPTPPSAPPPPPSAAPGWYYVRDKKKLGPVPPDELKALASRGQLAASDMVLKQGESRWAAASAEFPAFFPASSVEAPPPPVPAPIVAEPPPSSPALPPIVAEVPPPSVPPPVVVEAPPPVAETPPSPIVVETPPVPPPEPVVEASGPSAEPLFAEPLPEIEPEVLASEPVSETSLPSAELLFAEPESEVAPPPPPEAPPAAPEPMFADAILVEETAPEPTPELASPVHDGAMPWQSTPPAPPPAPELPPLPDLADAPPDELVARFEGDWLHGRRPELEDYLPSAPAARDAVLGRLLRVDLECRLRGGEEVRVEKYLERFPSLASDRAATLDAIAAEYESRRRWQPGVSRDEYANRFPQLAADVQARLASAATTLVSPEAAPAAPLSPSAAPPPARAAEPEKPGIRTLPDLPGFEILDVIDDSLYKARDIERGRTVALHLRRADGPEARRRDLEVLRRVARLQHPNLTAVYDSAAYGNEREGRYYIAAEWVDAQPLASHTHGWPLAPRQAAEWIESIAVALHEAHQHDLVHGGVSPEKITLSPAGEGKTTARVRGLGEPAPRWHFEKLALTDPAGARVAYLAPEQTRGEGAILSPATDVYALGAILFELLTGRPPLRDLSVPKTVERMQSQRPPLPSAVQPGLPMALDYICRKCLEKAPADRYANAQELAADLRRFLADAPVLKPVPRVWFLMRTRPVLSGVIGALVVVLLILWMSSSKIGRLQRDVEALHQKQAEKEKEETPAEAPTP